jgi:hypothetical protein
MGIITEDGWSACAPTAYEVVRYCRKFEKQCPMGQLRWWKARGSLTSDVSNPVVSQHNDKCLGSEIPAVQCSMGAEPSEQQKQESRAYTAV